MMTRGHYPLRHAIVEPGLTLLLLAALGACEEGAVQAVRELEAARGECTVEGLRASDEECVRAMENYAGMAAELIDTYIGGVQTLDAALRRMPPAQFDTVGLGYALSPEYRLGDPSGVGASPRLDRRSVGAERAAPGNFTLRPEDARASLNRPTDLRPAPSRYDAYRERSLSRPRYERSFRGARGQRSPSRRVPFGSFWQDRGWFPRHGYDRYTDRYSPNWFGWPSAPFAYGEYGAFDDRYGYGWYGRGGYGNFGYDPYTFGGYPPYAYGGYPPYTYGGYPRDPYGYDPYGYVEPFFEPRRGVDPYDGGLYDRRGYVQGDEPRYDDIPADPGAMPAEDWGYLPPTGGSGDPASQDGSVSPPAAAPARPAPHRPGFLLPPEERLRRPWIED